MIYVYIHMYIKIKSDLLFFFFSYFIRISNNILEKNIYMVEISNKVSKH